MNTHIRVVHCQFRKVEHPECHRVAQVAFQAEVDSVVVSAVCVRLVEVHLFLCASSMYADCFLCHCGKEGSHLWGFHEP